MRHRTFNESGDRDLLFLMGLGNRWTHENVSWLIGTCTDAGYRVHAVELPTHIDDFRADWVEPVAEVARDRPGYRLLAHGAGALVGQTLDGAATHVYLSPWWGHGPTRPDVLLEALAHLPTTAPVCPVGAVDRADLGQLATDHQLATRPSWVSAAFLRETRRAQRERLTVDHDAVVFCSLRDPLIDHRAIGRHVPARHVVLYDGGHELFSSRARDALVDPLLTAIGEGAGAIEGDPP